MTIELNNYSLPEADIPVPNFVRFWAYIINRNETNTS